MQDISLRKSMISDAEQLHELQIEAFSELLEKYRDYDTSPAAEKLERTIMRLKRAGSDYYFIRFAEESIGAIRIVRNDEIYELKQLYIIPAYQGRGFAQKTIKLMEAFYPEAVCWELETIKQEARLCHLYEKMGYVQTGKEEVINDKMTLVFYRKQGVR